MENSCFSGQLWPDWGNTTQAALAKLGSIGLRVDIKLHQYRLLKAT